MAVERPLARVTRFPGSTQAQPDPELCGPRGSLQVRREGLALPVAAPSLGSSPSSRAQLVLCFVFLFPSPWLGGLHFWVGSRGGGHCSSSAQSVHSCVYTPHSRAAYSLVLPSPGVPLKPCNLIAAAAGMGGGRAVLGIGLSFPFYQWAEAQQGLKVP